MSKLIGIYSPRAQSGKSTITRTLVEARGFTVLKFAAPLKDMVRGLLGSMGFDREATERMVEGDLKEQIVPGFKTVTPRHLMQTLGTDWGREAVDADLWTKVVVEKIKRLGDADIVIDDLRFPNEYDALDSLGGTLVRVERPGAELVGSPRYEGLLEERSFDVEIHNVGTLDDLRRKALAL